MFDHIFFRLSRDTIDSLCSSYKRGPDSCAFSADDGPFYVQVENGGRNQLTDATLTIGVEQEVTVQNTGNDVLGNIHS